jgi:lysophospholipase L1-like esterase
LNKGFQFRIRVTNVGRIIEELRAVNPNIAVIVGTLPPISGQQAVERAYNSALANHARRWSKSNSPVKVANLWSGYSPQVDTSDGEHPNDSGEEKIANRFFSPLRSLLARFKGGVRAWESARGRIRSKTNFKNKQCPWDSPLTQ